MSGLLSQSEGSLLRVILRSIGFGEHVQTCYPWIPGHGDNIGLVLFSLLYCFACFSGRCDQSINVFVPCLFQLGFGMPEVTGNFLEVGSVRDYTIDSSQAAEKK